MKITNLRISPHANSHQTPFFSLVVQVPQHPFRILSQHQHHVANDPVELLPFVDGLLPVGHFDLQLVLGHPLLVSQLALVLLKVRLEKLVSQSDHLGRDVDAQVLSLRVFDLETVGH